MIVALAPAQTLTKKQIRQQLKTEGISEKDFWFTWQFTGLDSKKHMPLENQQNGDYCYGCFVDTCTLIRYLQSSKKERR